MPTNTAEVAAEHPYVMPNELVFLQSRIGASRPNRACDLPLHEKTWKQSPAYELVRRATAPMRHKMRVDATKVAAHVASCHLGMGFGDERWDSNPLAAAVALLIDILGDGGPLGMGGSNGRSQRGWPFSTLGSGRRNARDGAAYRAAANEAFLALIRIYDEEGNVVHCPNSITVRWDNEHDSVCASVGIGGQPYRTTISLPTSEELSVIAGRALLAATGAAVVDDVDQHVIFCLDQNQAAAWYNDCCAKQPLPAPTTDNNVW